MAHHMAHAEKHETHHMHYVCPNCHGQGWVEDQPSGEKELNALRDYQEDLKTEVKKVQERVDELEHLEM